MLCIYDQHKMADVSLAHHDCVDDSDEGFEQGDCQMGLLEPSTDDEAPLTPLQKVQKYSRSNSTVTKQMVASVIIKLLRTQPAEVLAKDLPEIMKELTDVGEQSILRADLLDRIPHIAAQTLECAGKLGALKNVISDHLVPFVVRNLGSTDAAVDRTAQNALIQLVEQNFITKFQIEIQVCPSILALSKTEKSQDINAHNTAITLMSRLSHYLGRDVVERVFLKRFIELCSSPIFYVRKLCAANIGDLCSVVGQHTFESQLLPCYLNLCNDDVWNVRQACVEVVMYISSCCTPEQKKDILAPIFVKFLEDDCQWVQGSAYESLGYFISTFADPTQTKISYSSNGDLVLTNKDGDEFVMNCPRYLTLTERISVSKNEQYMDGDGDDFIIDMPKNSLEMNFGYLDDLANEVTNLNIDNDDKINNEIATSENGNERGFDRILNNLFNLVTDNENESNSNNSNNLNEKENVTPTTTATTTTNSIRDVNDNEKVNNMIGDKHLEDDLHLFNSHIYWYISPELPLDPNIIAGQDQQVSDDSFDIFTSTAEATTLSNITFAIESTFSENDEKNTVEERPEDATTAPPILKQNVIPQQLLEHYIKMTECTLSLSVGDNLTYHCAYALPAVASTLGKENWHLLRSTVELLASDMHYKVRKTVASSLHELAIILGPEVATEELAPLFDDFLKDLDEVRIGILKNLANFLKLVDPIKRTSYLARLGDFLRTDNEWNWRFRHELAQQLLDCITLFKPADTAKHLGSITIDLLCDKVAAVREIALSLITEIVNYISSESGLTPTLLMKLTEHFAHSKKWKRRQTFCLVCEELLSEETLPPELFASEIMPHLLDLSWDPVANVRLVVARCLSRYLITNSYFTNPNNEHYDGLETVLRRLQADKDRDVRQSAEVEELY